MKTNFKMNNLFKVILFLASGVSSFVMPKSGSTFLHEVGTRDVKLYALDEFVTTSIFGAAVYFTVTKADQFDAEVRAEYKIGDRELEIESEDVEDMNEVEEVLEEEEEEVTEEVEEIIEDTPKTASTVAVSSTIDVSLKKSVASTLTGERQKQDRLKASASNGSTKESAPPEPEVEEAKQKDQLPDIASTTTTVGEASFGKKAILKVFMPWKKFSSIE